MSEYIKREDVEKAILDCPISGMLDLINLQTAITNIDTIPSADVVEVVRCKDCIHNGSIDTDCPFGWKDKKFNMPNPHDYCSYGEQKEQEHEKESKEKA